MASNPITSWQIDWGKWKQWQTIFLGSKITADYDSSHEIKRHLLLGRNLDSLLEGRDITFLTSLYSQVYDFSSIQCMAVRVGPYEKGWVPKNWYSQTAVLQCWRKFLRFPWTAKGSNQSILKEIIPEYSLEGMIRNMIWKCFLSHC